MLGWGTMYWGRGHQPAHGDLVGWKDTTMTWGHQDDMETLHWGGGHHIDVGDIILGWGKSCWGGGRQMVHGDMVGWKDTTMTWGRCVGVGDIMLG